MNFTSEILNEHAMPKTPVNSLKRQKKNGEVEFGIWIYLDKFNGYTILDGYTMLQFNEIKIW